MMDDIVCLLQDLGKETSVEVIANFLIRNPELEDLVAAKMGSILSTHHEPTTATSSASNRITGQDLIPYAASLIPSSLASAFGDMGNLKMTFVVNMELQMGRGKQCAQVAHAALGLYLQIQESRNDRDQSRLLQWLTLGQKKIVLKGESLADIKRIQAQASEANIPTLLISDAGCTQIAPGSKTVLGLFGTYEELDKITGSLKLL